MNKKPVMFRFWIAVIVVFIFGISIFPISPKDFFVTFNGMLIKDKKGPKIETVISRAKKLVKVKHLSASDALLAAATTEQVDLTKYVRAKGLINNREVVSLIRKNSAASIRLGLDLNGGVEFLLELEPEKQENAAETQKLKENFNRYRDTAIEILRNRLESERIYESEISPEADKYISLRVPVVSKYEKDKLLKLIQMSAKLQFRLIRKDNEKLVKKYLRDPKAFRAPVGYQKMDMISIDKKGKPLKQVMFVKIKPEMTGKNIVDARVDVGQFGRRRILLRFNPTGATVFGDVTTKYVDHRLGIVLDGKLYSAPYIKQAITGGSAEITGDFTKEEAQNISNALISGSLPVRINVEAMFDTAPTLGKASVHNGFWAGIYALIAVIVFMAAYYFRAGIVADIALAANVILVLGALAAFEATLTLPGIAGIILTIGMAVDANVLIFERIREELNNGKTLMNAIENGYNRAFITILDANLTTLFTALILMWQGTGAIKGFAVTLSIGILTSMFTALFLTRLIFDIMARYRPFSQKMKMVQYIKDTKIDFLGLRNLTVGASGTLFIGSLIIFVVYGKSMMGVDFTGGTQLLIPLTNEKVVPVEEARKVLEDNGFRKIKVTLKRSLSNRDNKSLEVIIKSHSISNAKGRQAVSPMGKVVKILQEKFPKAGFSEGGSENTLGGLIGWEFTKSAIIALIFALFGIVIYISIRFEFAYAIASIIALVHDVVIATGVYVICGRELSLPVIAALLTILGYSLNDTIVVFDRIREDLELVKNKSYKEIINLSINQTLSRTLLTSVSTFLVLVIMFLFGGVAINNFILVLMLGVIIGTYSSVFIASPIVAVWHKRVGSTKKADEETRDKGKSTDSVPAKA